MGKSNKKGREARLSRKREKRNLREKQGRRQRARQEGIAAQTQVAAARSTTDDVRAMFLQEGAEPLSEDLIRELTGERGWQEKDLRDAAATGALYLRPDDSLVWPDGAPPVSWSDDPGVRAGEYGAQGINPRLMLPWKDLPPEDREQALAEARAYGREALEEEYDALMDSGELDDDATADYNLELIDDGLHPHDVAYWRRKRKPVDPRAIAFLKGWKERRAEIRQERGAEGVPAAAQP